MRRIVRRLLTMMMMPKSILKNKSSCENIKPSCKNKKHVIFSDTITSITLPENDKYLKWLAYLEVCRENVREHLKFKLS